MPVEPAVVLGMGVGTSLLFAGYFFRSRTDRNRGEAASVENTPVVSIDSVRLALSGPGAPPSLYCHIKGQTYAGRMNTPRTAKLSGQYCLQAKTTVTREYEEKYEVTDPFVVEESEEVVEEKTDKNGKTTRKVIKRKEKKRRRRSDERRYAWRHGTDVIFEDTVNERVYVYDGSGSCEIRFSELDVKPDFVSVVHHFEERENQADSFRLSYGQFSVSLPMRHREYTGDRRLLGYSFTEDILPVDENVVVLGDAYIDPHGHLSIRRPRTDENNQRRPYICSRKAILDVVEDMKTSASKSKVLSDVTYVAAAAMLGFGVFKLFL